jgi:hypothetical protein
VTTLRTGLLTILVLAAPAFAGAQEREPPKDSERLTITGCVNNRTLIAASTAEHETIKSGVSEGRRFRLAGPGKMLDEIKARKGRMVEITGLVKKSDVAGPGGIKIAGGRIRSGGQRPQTSIASDPTRDPAYNQVVLDVEGWRALAESCSR